MGKIISPKRKQGRVEYPTTLAKAVLVNEGKEGMTVQDFIDDEPRRLAEIYEPVFADTLPEPSAATMRKLYLIPADYEEGDDVKEEYITARELVDDEYVYRWEKLGRTAPTEIFIMRMYDSIDDFSPEDLVRLKEYLHGGGSSNPKLFLIMDFEDGFTFEFDEDNTTQQDEHHHMELVGKTTRISSAGYYPYPHTVFEYRYIIDFDWLEDTVEITSYERVATSYPEDRHVLISKSAYDQLVEDEEVDPELIYMVYEDEDEEENENENEEVPSEPSPNL